MSDDGKDRIRLGRSLAADDAARERWRLGGGRHELVDNAARRRSPSGLSGRGAVAWLLRNGRRRVFERTGWRPTLIDLNLERWLADVGGDHAALCGIIRSAVSRTRAREAKRFEALVIEGIQRQKRNGPQLQLALISPLVSGAGEAQQRGASEKGIAREPAKPGAIPFPLSRRSSLVERLAMQVASRSATAGDSHLRRQLERQAKALRRAGVSEQAIEREIRAVTAAIFTELSQLKSRRADA